MTLVCGLLVDDAVIDGGMRVVVNAGHRGRRRR